MFIEINNLSKSFNNKKAIDNLSFSVKKGELLCILGPSGCGKTTVLRNIGGFLTPDSGSIKIDGVDISDLAPENRPVSTVFQSYALFPHMTVIQNIIYGLKFKGIKKKEALALGEEFLDLVGLANEGHKKVTQLSGGQQQRVALARSLIIKPKVLLLDEPLSNLDAKLRLKMREEIKSIQKQFNITMIFVTHDQEEALSMADRVLIMNQGRLEQIDHPINIYNKPNSKFVLDFIGSSNIIAENNDFIEFVRPEKISINHKSGSKKGSISNIVFHGPHIIYEIDCQDQSFFVEELNNKDSNYKLGQTVFISYSINKIKKTSVN